MGSRFIEQVTNGLLSLEAIRSTICNKNVHPRSLSLSVPQEMPKNGRAANCCCYYKALATSYLVKIIPFENHKDDGLLVNGNDATAMARNLYYW